MQKPLIFNRFLNKKWNEYENIILCQKIKTAKSTSIISKTKNQSQSFKPRPRQEMSEMKKYEITKNNEVLKSKLTNVISYQKKIKNPHENLKNLPSLKKKWEILNISKENQAIVKRMQERNSIYTREKFERDYQKNEKYVSNICEFPHIDFLPHKTFSNSFSRKNKSDLNTNQHIHKGVSKSKFSGSDSNFYKKKFFFQDSQKTIETENNEEFNLLHKIHKNFENYGLCLIKFLIDNKKFIISIEHLDSKDKHFLIFNDIEDILNIQNLYKNYEEISENLFFGQGKIEFSQNSRYTLNYVFDNKNR